LKILLACAAGMSTSLLVEAMKRVARERGLDVEILALPVHEAEEQISSADVILLGPQVRYTLKDFKETAGPLGKPVEVIDSVAYGMVNGAKVLDQALALL
jgi:PTS system cellobiose-specific IIB component